MATVGGRADELGTADQCRRARSGGKSGLRQAFAEFGTFWHVRKAGRARHQRAIAGGGAGSSEVVMRVVLAQEGCLCGGFQRQRVWGGGRDEGAEGLRDRERQVFGEEAVLRAGTDAS